jgi:hypothetical protein
MIYSESFEALPPYVQDYIDARIVEGLQGRDAVLASKLSAADRTAISQILADTLPRFAKPLGVPPAIAGTAFNAGK